MIRIALCSLVVAAFVAFGYAGAKRWMHGPEAASETADSEGDQPLRTGFLAGHHLGHFGSMGNPWQALREEFLAAKRDLPPDPAPVSTEQAEKDNRIKLGKIPVSVKPGRTAWPQFYAAVHDQIEAGGVRVTTGTPAVADTYVIDVPDVAWTGMTVLGDTMSLTNRDVVFVITSEGVNIGTDEACNRATRDAALVGLRRRVAADNADPRLDVPFRPDVKDANLVAFVTGMTAQTGVEVAVDPQIWEKGPALTWRGPPRSLRQALDELCAGFRWYWRWHGGRVWLLKA